MQKIAKREKVKRKLNDKVINSKTAENRGKQIYLVRIGNFITNFIMFPL